MYNPLVSFNEEALVSKFTTLLDRLDKGNVTDRTPIRRAPHVGLTRQLNHKEVPFDSE